MSTYSDQRSPKRLLALAVFAVLAAVAVGTAALVKEFVDDQERRLLEKRASEASALISSVFEGQVTTMELLARVTEAAPGSAGAVLERLVPDDAPVTAGTAIRAGGDIVVESAAGGSLAAGERLAGPRLGLVNRAFVADGVVSTVHGQQDERLLMFAVAVGGSDRVILQEFSFGPEVLDRDDREGLFDDLDGAVYAADEALSDRLLFATTHDLPIRDGAIERSVQVGADEWTMVVRGSRPLVGSLAGNAEWLTLAGGLTTAALVGAMVEVVNRRRAYALRLVATRTRELRAALAEKERLEQEERRAREAAEEANQSKSEFLSRMSHELRTPLNAVLGFAQLLELEDLDDDGRESVRQILKGGWHLLDLINEVLDIARIEAGRFHLSPEPVLVSDVVGDVAQLTGPLAAHANIELTSAVTDADDRHVLADRQRLKQVLLNLVSNAIKYNRVGGSVTLSCASVDSEWLRIQVHDTGPGIPSHHLELLFRPFERLGAEQTSVEGTGIGLALSRRLAEAMGGRLDLETTLGEGTTFWIELPIVEGPMERYERTAGERQRTASTPASDTRTVLYVEDNLANLRLVERVLGDDPAIALISAAQGRLGLDLAREHQPGLILLDLHLPDIGGDEVLRALRADPATASIPVVIVSADATAGQTRRLLAEGAHAYVTKPIDVAELRAIIDDLPVPNP